MISSACGVSVVVPYVRGHIESPNPQDEGDHSGLRNKDLTGLIGNSSRNSPNTGIFVGEHSSGGRLMVRFFGAGIRAPAHVEL